MILGLLAATSMVAALPCISFDSQWNLYAFGVQGQYDWSLGQQSSWNASSGANVTNVDKTNAPPFNGNNTQCFLAEFFNAIYVLDGDASNPSAVHIFDGGSKTWSEQTVDASTADLTTMVAILDHDTNVFFGISGGTLFQLDMSSLTQATSQTLNWETVGQPSFNTTGYAPVLGHADNHIYFLDVPGNPAGEANIFVIHFSYFQPSPQAYTVSANSKVFPAVGGKTVSLFQPSTGILVPRQFVFFPNDGSGTYIVDVIQNTTTTLAFPPAPPSSGTSAYAGSDSALVQLTPSGELYFVAVDETQLASDTSATWNKIQNSLWTPPGTATSTTAAAGSSGSPGTSGTAGAAKSAHTSASTSSKSAAMMGRGVHGGLVVLAAAAVGMLVL